MLGTVRLWTLSAIAWFSAVGVSSAGDAAWNLPGDGVWHDPASWLGGVPDRGDTAAFAELPAGNAIVTLDRPASVASIDISNNNRLEFQGDPLTFDVGESGREAAISLSGSRSDLLVQTDIQWSGLLVIGTGPTASVLTLARGSGAASEDMLKSGDGTLRLAGDSSSWSGELRIEGGIVSVGHAGALGDLLGSTVLARGVLQIPLPTAEPIVMQDGLLELDGAGHANTITASGGAIQGSFGNLSEAIAMDGGILSITGNGFAVDGGTTGHGDLILRGSDFNLRIGSPLAHAGTTTVREGTIGLRVGGNVFSGGNLIIDGGSLNISSLVSETVGAGRIFLRSGAIVRAESVDPAVGLSFTELEVNRGTLDVPLHGSGSLVKKNANTDLILHHDNSYTGQTVVESGRLLVDHPNGLGSSSGDDHDATIVLPGGTLAFESLSTNRTFAPEKVILAGGTLRAESHGDVNRYIYWAGPLEITADSVLRGGASSRLTIEGDVTGSSGITFEASSNPVGNGFYFLGPTSYMGETVIGSNTFVSFRHPQSLGDSSAGTRVMPGGALTLHGGTSSERIVLARGAQLSLLEAPTAYELELVLRGAILHPTGSSSVEQSVILSKPVEVIGGAQLGIQSIVDAPLVFRESVHGTGTLRVEQSVTFRGAVENTGDVLLEGINASATFRGPFSSGGDLFLRGGSANLESDGGEFSGDIVLAPSASHTLLRIRRDRTVGRMILDLRNTHREGFVDNGVIDVDEGVTLTIGEELRFFGGRIKGRIAGQDVLTKQSRLTGWLERTEGSGFREIRVEAGTLELVGTQPVDPPAIHLAAADTSQLRLDNVGIYQGDLFLSETNGNEDLPRLASLNGSILAGNIFLAEGGSSISEGEITGPIHGGALQKLTTGSLVLRGGDHTYSGATVVHRGELVLTDAGALNSTSELVTEATVTLNNRGSTGMGDRVPDTTPVILRNGRLILTSRSIDSVGETLGNVRLAGASVIEVSDEELNGYRTTLTLDTLLREPGATVNFLNESLEGRIRLASMPQLDDGLLGGWTTVGDVDFATYGPEGILPYSELHGYSSDLNSSLADDNVFLHSSDATLGSNRSINALRLRNSDIDLNGHRLRLESGGILFFEGTYRIAGGELTAGADGPGELIINMPSSGAVAIDASISDNGSNPVGFTAAGRGEVTLSGANTYTGTTHISGTAAIRVTSASALPPGGDLLMAGGQLRVDLSGSKPIQLGQLTMQPTGLIRVVGSHGTKPPIQAETYRFDGGQVEVPLYGDGELIKSSPARLRLDENSPDYLGRIVVEEGNLEAGASGAYGQAPLDEDHAIIVRQGGSLDADSMPAGSRMLLLEGGILEQTRGAFSGPIVVARPSIVRGAKESRIEGTIAGSADLTLDGPFFGINRNDCLTVRSSLNEFEGNLLITGGEVRIEGDNREYHGRIDVRGQILATRGSPFALGQGSVTIFSEGNLELEEPLSAEIHLIGGGIRFRGQMAALEGPTRILADSNVYAGSLGDSRGFATFAGPVHFADQVDLKLSQDLLAEYTEHAFFSAEAAFQGDVVLEGAASITSYDVPASFSGTIRTAGAASTLDLHGSADFNLHASLIIEEGHDLGITRNGEPVSLVLDGFGKRLSGTGTLHNSILVQNHAAVVPEVTRQGLVIDGDIEIGDQGRLIVELRGATTAAAYGHLKVLGEAGIDGLLDLVPAEDFSPSPTEELVILAARHVSGVFRNADGPILVGDYRMEVAYSETEVIIRNIARVPEPSTLVLLSLLLSGLALTSRFIDLDDCDQSRYEAAGSVSSCSTR